MTHPYPRNEYYAEIIAARATIAALQTQLANYRALLRPIETLPRSWRLTPTETQIAIALARSNNGLRKCALHEIINPETEAKIVDVFVCKVRKKLAPHGITIETIWGDGFRMPCESRLAVMAAMEGESYD